MPLGHLITLIINAHDLGRVVRIDDKDQIIEINPNSSAACAAGLAATSAVGRHEASGKSPLHDVKGVANGKWRKTCPRL